MVRTILKTSFFFYHRLILNLHKRNLLCGLVCIILIIMGVVVNRVVLYNTIPLEMGIV